MEEQNHSLTHGEQIQLIGLATNLILQIFTLDMLSSQVVQKLQQTLQIQVTL
jgi:hypothetical protein